MTEDGRTGYSESPDTADANSAENMVDGTPGNDRSDGGEADAVLLTDDEAQRDDDVLRPGNAGS